MMACFYGNLRCFGYNQYNACYDRPIPLLSASYCLRCECGYEKLRVGEHEERVGLDLTQHREAAYTLID